MPNEYEEAAIVFLREHVHSLVLRNGFPVRSLSELLESYARKVPRAPADTISKWREIEGAIPPMWERIYERIEPNTWKELVLIGNISVFRAGISWMLICNGRILRQSELIEGPEPMRNAQLSCDDFRDRVVAMWHY